jgi:hypothetical protein
MHVGERTQLRKIDECGGRNRRLDGPHANTSFGLISSRISIRSCTGSMSDSILR